MIGLSNPLFLWCVGCAWVGLMGDVTEQKVVAFDAAAHDIFGAAVAIDGELALVCNEWDDDNGIDSGSVYAYSWNGTAWDFDQKFSPADNGPGNNFGRALFMQGQRAVVGAHWDDDKGFRSGSVYTLQYDGSDWVEQQKLTASDGQANDAFGNSVSLDDEWIAVGSWHEDQAGNNAGAVYMFRYTGSAWVQDQKIQAPDTTAGDEFGRYVSVSGGRVLIGSWKEDQGATDAGAAYIYQYNGNEWALEQKLVAFDGAATDYYGWVTYLNGDVAAVGAFQDDDQGTNSGSVYIYRYNGSSWLFEQKLLASDGVAHDWFGYSLSLSGNRVAVAAAVGPLGVGPGYGYMFRHNGTKWVQKQKLVPSDGADQDKFGFQLSMSSRDGVVLSGAWRDDDAGLDTGSAYFYHCAKFISLPPTRPTTTLGRLKAQIGVGFLMNPPVMPSGPPVSWTTGTAPGCW